MVDWREVKANGSGGGCADWMARARLSSFPFNPQTFAVHGDDESNGNRSIRFTGLSYQVSLTGFTIGLDQRMRLPCSILLGVLGLAGCARVEFSDGWVPDGAHFYDPVPYVLVTESKDCTTTAALVALPGPARTAIFHSGYGSANLSANFQNGILSSVGQQTDTKIPETIAALTGIAAAVPKLAAPAARAAPAPPACPAKAILFQIRNGTIDTTPIPLPIPS